MEAHSDTDQLQDYAMLQCALLAVLEAAETKKWPKTFFVFNDSWNADALSRIARQMEKLGIEVPDSEK